MNILITAGGTIEPIDNVRSITNTGTGRLGSLIADEFLDSDKVDKLFYICTEKSVKPNKAGAIVKHVNSVYDLEKCMLNTLKENRVDVIIHSMAVSDYSVRSVVNIDTIVDALDGYSQLSDNADNSKTRSTENYLLNKLDAGNLNDGSGKISSQLNHPLILLEKTPKILSMLREHAGDAIIVGFKLLTDCPKNQLIDTAYNLLKNNKCDFVLANDLSSIEGDKHTGYLVDQDKNILEFSSKKDIAQGLKTTILYSSVLEVK